MSEDDDESRAGRLRDRRKRTRNRTSTQDQEVEEETDKPEETSEPSEPSKTSKSKDCAGTGDASVASPSTSVKDEQTGTYMYLPDSLVSELAYQFKINSAEYERATGEEFEKNRHWYPLLLSLGLEQVEEMDPKEMQSRLNEERGD